MALLYKHQYWHKSLVVLVVLLLTGCSTTPTKDSDTRDTYNNLYRGSSENKTANAAAIAADTPEEAIARGDEAYRKRQYDIALYEYVEALKLNGGDTETLNKVGDIHFTLEDLDSAGQAYNASIQLDNDNQHALQGLGLVQLRTRKYEQAKSNLIKALELNTELWHAHNGLGTIADIEGNYTTAIEYYRHALRLKPDSPQVLNNLGYSEYLSGNWNMAMMHFVRAVNSNPNYDRAWYNIGLIYTRQGSYEDAFVAFRNVLDTPQAYNDIGYLSMMDGYYDIADMYFQKAIKTSPSYYLKAHENIVRLERLKERGATTQLVRNRARTSSSTPFNTQPGKSQNTTIAVDAAGIPVVKIAPSSSTGVVDITSAGNTTPPEKINADIAVKSTALTNTTKKLSLAEVSQSAPSVAPDSQAPSPGEQASVKPNTEVPVKSSTLTTIPEHLSLAEVSQATPSAEFESQAPAPEEQASVEPNTEVPVKSSILNTIPEQSSLAEISQSASSVTPESQAPAPEERISADSPEVDEISAQPDLADKTAPSSTDSPDINNTISDTAPVLSVDENEPDKTIVTAPDSVASLAKSPASTTETKEKSYSYSNQGEQAEYRKALAMVRDGQFEEAAVSFNAFLHTFPDSSYADNANYWIGETYYVIRDFEPALETFTGLVEEFPDSPKVPDTRLKIGYIHYEQQNWSAARQELKGIVSAYPDTEVAQLASARLKRMEDEAH